MTNKLKAITQRSQMEMGMSQEESGGVRMSQSESWRDVKGHRNSWKLLEGSGGLRNGDAIYREIGDKEK